MAKVRIGKALVDNVTQQEAVEKICQFVSHGSKTYVVTPNLDHIVKLDEDEEFKRAYDQAGLVLADGNPVVWASKILGTPLKALVTGSDLFPVLCQTAGEVGYSVFFLGGLDGVASKAAENLRKKFPKLNVTGAYSPPFGFEKNQTENRKICDMINQSGAQILFVGVGAPKQEKWMYHNIDSLNVNVALGIGASFDFEAGTVKRAPLIFRKAGLEWFWRVVSEPRRLFKRYFIDSAAFVPIIARQWRSRKNSVSKIN